MNMIMVATARLVPGEEETLRLDAYMCTEEPALTSKTQEQVTLTQHWPEPITVANYRLHEPHPSLSESTDRYRNRHSAMSIDHPVYKWNKDLSPVVKEWTVVKLSTSWRVFLYINIKQLFTCK